MANTVLYRISSGEVVKISTRGQILDNISPTYFAYLTDPSMPDGTDNRETIDGQWGPARVLGYQKIAIPGSDLVRNATQPEIDAFAGFQTEDENNLDASGATSFLETHPRFRKVFKAILKLLVQQLLENSNVKQNQMIDQWNQFKVDVAGASNLGNLKTDLAAQPSITSDLPETATLTTIANQLKALIDKDD